MSKPDKNQRLTTLDSPKQLPLGLPNISASSRDDLVVTAANQQAVNLLNSWPAWPGQVAILAGPVGAGKTHLAKIWADRAQAEFLDCDHKNLSEQTPISNFVVEDITKGGFCEIWLFHLFNAVKSSNKGLLLTSRYWPGDWDISLPDLKSRLKTAALMELNEPDDALLLGVMSKLFSDRQISVSPNVLDYLVIRMERSLAAAQTLVAEIDAQSLSQKRPVTRSLAADVLRNLGLQD